MGSYKVAGDAVVEAITQYYDAAHYKSEQRCFHILFWQNLLIISIV